MKKYILLAFILSCHLVQAQDYENICTKGITFYINNVNQYMAFRRDSSVANASMDTTFFSYRAIRDTSLNQCVDVTNGSVLGLKIVKTHTGWFYFFNRRWDTIRINATASLNDSWKFCALPANGYIEAKVTSLENDSVMGVIDPVKVIAFQAKDSAGNTIMHLLNGRNIKLSQHYGLASMLDVYYIPGDTNVLNLAGKSNPKVGIQDLTWQDIFKFNIGDTLHDTVDEYGPYSGIGIRTVLSKSQYGNDSVNYQMESCGKYTFGGPWHNTYSWTYSFAQDPDNIWLSRGPREFIPNNYCLDVYAFLLDTLTNRRMKSITYQQYCSIDLTCYGNTYYGMPERVSWEHYTDGLGETLYWYWAQVPPHGTYWNLQELVYYHKGSEIWGKPVAKDCTSFLGIDNPVDKDYPNISVFPNPVTTQAEIEVRNLPENEIGYFTLTDFFGELILRKNFDSDSHILNRNGIAGGMYFLSVYKKDGMLIGQSKIIFR